MKVFPRYLIVLAAVLTCALTAFATVAQGSDQIGLYFDEAYTQESLFTSGTPTMVPVYLVLHDPSAAGGVGGWECRLQIEGSATLAGTDLEGGALNVQTPPSFMVGIPNAPLPDTDGDVLLATFNLWVEDADPIFLSLMPLYLPSITGRMAYLNADGSDELIPLSTVTGIDAAAAINGEFSVICDVAPETVGFTETAIGAVNERYFYIRNEGSVPFTVDVGFSGDCPEFSLVNIDEGPLSVGAFRSQLVTVAFAPTEVGYRECVLDLGGPCPGVTVYGTGREPILEFDAPDELAFGAVENGDSEYILCQVYNTGEVPFTVQPSLPADCVGFRVTSTSSYLIEPDASFTTFVYFEPDALGDFACTLDLGETVPPVALTGTGVSPVMHYTVTPDAVDFGEVTAGTVNQVDVVFRNLGVIPIHLDLSILPNDGVFQLPQGFDSRDVVAGGTTHIYVDYIPPAAGSFSASLLLGDEIDPVPLTGSAHAAVIGWTAPDVLDFGVLEFGETATLPLTVTNTGNTTFDVAPTQLGGCSAFEVSGPAATLEPGQASTWQITFSPTVLGQNGCLLDMGDVVPDIELTGTCFTEVTAMEVEPGSLDFPMTIAGNTSTLQLVVTNTGTVPLLVDPVVAPADQGFAVVSGAGEPLIGPGVSRTLTVQFAPVANGSYAAEIGFGTDLPVVPLTATCEEPVYDCAVFPEFMDFGEVTVGTAPRINFTVTNRGNQDLVLEPSVDSPVFLVGSGPFTVAPNASVTLGVTFRPLVAGTWFAEVDLGPDFCATISCAGVGVVQPNWDHDIVGFTFDPGSLQYGYFHDNITAVSGSLLPAYLALINPSSYAGLAGWECCAGIEGPASFASWEIDGLPVNVLQEPCFMVGLGEPLPPAPYYILATAQVFVMSSDTDIFLTLNPVYYASFPDEMAWLEDGPDQRIIPMRTYTGTEYAACINSYSPLGVAAPLPAAQVTGGAVTLSWPAPTDGEYDGCRVLRRTGEGDPQVISDGLVPLTGATITYVDEPRGLSEGAVLHYSYALIADGKEVARSPEIEITLQGVPTLATRLLPNVPNPFNPQTEIRFELAEAGPARVTVYDVTGRLVRVLVNEGLAAGPQTRMWNGTDNAGKRVSSGAYYVRLETDGRIDHRKILLLK